MQLENTIVITGTLKNIKFPKTNDSRVNGWLNQRAISSFNNGEHDRQTFITGMNVTTRDPEVMKTLLALDSARQGQPETQQVKITGRLTTWIRKSQADGGKDEFVPQIEVFAVDTE